MQQPREIDVDDSQPVVERVAGIDVAKATGMVCTRTPHGNVAGRRVSEVWEVKATTKGLLELADHLVGARIERVVLESTSDYWRCFFSAPRGALTYPPRSGEGLEVTSLGPMADLDSKGEGDNSMPLNRLSCPGVWGGESVDPRDMAKA